ncbi:hypothetical protein DS885_13825 [Psychromonas sp. B3M02]|uniref:hypothetical protein n=1 Tax=Psychromonas sp. B3M02 TaxID=2267226 RepID=UPI000DEA4F02|nr:hypothetical protein [Psychromonas sp. B3M02]RBW43119.1 hypothetical protein DS885_13825 [Psychromonas sp. B3M02]
MVKQVALRLGEKIMPKAPKVLLSNGNYCVPQHYLTYHHTLASIEALICDIEYDPRYVVFAAQEASGLYIQVGVIGHDNYHKKSSLKANQEKLLFGRKWRVEPELPTSEVIQSVFLAIKKSREHEVRELFKLTLNDSTTTPFNTHIDLPLMAEFYNKKDVVNEQKKVLSAEQEINDTLTKITYDHSTLSLSEVQQRPNGLWLVDINVHQSQRSTLTEMTNATLYLMVEDLTLNTLSRALMQEFIRLSDLQVDKHFNYRGFHRFDPSIDIADIADLSQQTRKHDLAAHFANEFSKTNQKVDLKRIPPVQAGALAQKHKQIIEQYLQPAG